MSVVYSETKIFPKDPLAVVDFNANWLAWLDGDTIDSVTWTVPSGLTKDSQGNTDSRAVVWLSGGVDNTRYKVRCHIATAAGREDVRSFYIVCRDR